MNLEKIIEKDLCTGCGICISQDTSNTSTMHIDSNGFYKPLLSDQSSTNAMSEVCPFNFDNALNDEDKLATIFFESNLNTDFRLGKFSNTYIGFSENFRETSSSGGVGTFIIKELLDKKIVDVVYSVKQINGNICYAETTKENNILDQSTTRYIPVTLEQFFKKIKSENIKAAVTGVGCFIKAIRLKQLADNEFNNIITIGIICGGMKSTFYTDYLARKSGCHGEFSNPEYRVKNINSFALDYSFQCTDNSSKTIKRIPMLEVGDMWGTGLFKAKACDLCDDITSELADISLGDAWLQPYEKDGKGNSLVITRNPLFNNIIENGIKSKELVLDTASIEQVYQSQVGAINHKQKGLKTRVEELEKISEIKINKREKYFQETPIEFQSVQKFRVYLRQKSIALWKENQEEFDMMVQPDLDTLKSKTKRYHKLGKLRKKFKFLGLCYV